MTELTTKQKIAEAEAAYHSLMIGESEVTISRNGKSVTFTATNAEKLSAYIQQLKSIDNPALRRRAMTVIL